MRTPRRVAPRRTGLVLVGLAALAIVLPGLALAATVKDLGALASGSPYLMTCSNNATDVTCFRDANLRLNRPARWDARIEPETGQELFLDTRGTGVTPLDGDSRNWMYDMHQTACGAAKAVNDFVNEVGSLAAAGTIKRVIGNCDFTGSFNGGGGAFAPIYVVASTFLPPTPPPPTPSPKPTPKPTATPAPTPSAVPSATPSPSASPAPTESPSLAPSATPTPSPTAASSETGDPGTTDPPDSDPGTTDPPDSGPGPTPEPTQPAFSQSVAGITDVSTEPDAIAWNLILALLTLLFIGFVAELFDNTVEQNYEEISGWFRKSLLGRLEGVAAFLGRSAGFGLFGFLVLMSLVNALVDPTLGIDLRSLGEFLGFFVGLLVILTVFLLPQRLARRRRTGEFGRLRPMPWALVIALLFVLVSRIASFEPGYLYAVVLGVVFVQEVPERVEGREAFFGSLLTLGGSVLAWLALEWVQGLPYDPDGFGMTLLATTSAVIVVGGLEAVAFGLMPITFLPGRAVYRWNRLGWALLFGLSAFAFFHILIGPTSGYISELSPEAFVAALGVFAAFGTLSLVTWGYFRFRPARVEA